MHQQPRLLDAAYPPCAAVWLYYSKSLSCCVAIRGLLDDGSGLLCPPTDFSAPCREFTGNCADTFEQVRIAVCTALLALNDASADGMI